MRYRRCTLSLPLQLLPKSNPLETIQAGTTQRFYFDTRGGELQDNFLSLRGPPLHLHLNHLTFPLMYLYEFIKCAGVLLPGQNIEFPFTFKSPNAGIFTETWSLQTGPVLNRGRPITVTLKGVAFQDDLTLHKREQLEVRKTLLF